MAGKNKIIQAVLDFIFSTPEPDKQVNVVVRDETPSVNWPPVLEIAIELMPTILQSRGPFTPNKAAKIALDYAEELIRGYEERRNDPVKEDIYAD